MTSIVDKILVISEVLGSQRLPFAFGGALALAFCTERARGTIGIDVNVFVSPDQAGRVVNSLPPGLSHSDQDLVVLERDGQIRLWWEQTPVDIFLDTTDFHLQVAQRRQIREFGGRQTPFLGCSDLAVFKVFFNRTKDWADLEEMMALGSVNVDQTLGVLVRYLGEDDERVQRLRSLSIPERGSTRSGLRLRGPQFDATRAWRTGCLSSGLWTIATLDALGCWSAPSASAP
jgi:hypothetical protein